VNVAPQLPVPPLGSLLFHRMVSVPRPGARDYASTPAELAAETDAARARILAALVGARTMDSPVAVAWVRPEAHAPLDVYVGGPVTFGGAAVTDAGDTALLYPPGSRGVPVAAASVEQALDRLPYWVRCGGLNDSMVGAEAGTPPVRRGATFEDYVAYLSGLAFAWLVIGEPSPAIDAEMERLLALIPLYRDNAGSSEEDRLLAERYQARYRELARSHSSGLWNVHVLVGAKTESHVRQVAALLCSGSDLTNLPYVLIPTRGGTNFVRACQAPLLSETAPSPFQATAELLAALARPPEKEVPGVRLVTPPTFDVTGETRRKAKGEVNDDDEVEDDVIELGSILDGALQPAGSFFVARGTLNRHTFVCGATGAGKSQTVRALLEALSVSDIPWLVIEPAKAEYARMASRLAALGRTGAVRVIRPGDPCLIPAALNPLEPERGFPLQTHIDLVRALFLAAFEADEPFPQVLSAALTRCYEDLGWNLVLSAPREAHIVPRYPNLGDLQRSARAVVETIGYGREVTDNVRGFVDVRIGSLRLGTPGRFFEGGHPLDIAALLEHNVVVEIENIGNDQDKAFLIGTVLIRIIEHLRVYRSGSTTLRHVTVVEEAHRLLKNVVEGSPAAHAVELFAGLLAEIRAYGEGIVVAEQIPAKILPDVVKNTALKIVHRLPAQDDRDAVGATMNLDQIQSQYVVTLPPGTAAAFADGMDRPVLLNVPLTARAKAESTEGALPKVPLARVWSRACGASCQIGRPCTLRQIDGAVRLAEDPQITVWIELLVVGHLLGLSRPIPRPAWRTALLGRIDDMIARERGDDPGDTPERRLECAIAHRAQAAVDVRYPEIVLLFTPDDLAAHVAAVALAQALGHPSPCGRVEYWYQAGPYRWMDVRSVLTKAVRTSQPTDGPHPATDTWRTLRGLSLDGDTPAAQLDALRRQPAARRPKDNVVYGLVSPAPLVRAIAALSGHEEWRARLAEALDFLSFGTTPGSIDWSGAYLTTPQTLRSSKASS